MKAVTSAFDQNDSAQSKLNAQMGVLSKQIDVQKQRVQLLGDQYAQASRKAQQLNAELVDAIQTHAVLAVAAAWIPVTGLDMAALAANTWGMYIHINKLLSLSFSENMMKSIGSAVAANLTSNLAVAGVGSLLKFIPGIGSVSGGFIMSATMYGATLCAAWIYLMAIVNWVKEGKGSGDDLQSCVNDVIAQNKDRIKAMMKEARAEYKNKESK